MKERDEMIKNYLRNAAIKCRFFKNIFKWL